MPQGARRAYLVLCAFSSCYAQFSWISARCVLAVCWAGCVAACTSLRHRQACSGMTHQHVLTMPCLDGSQFITAAAPNFDAPGTNTNQEAYRLQLKMFLGLIAQQQHLPPLKQLLQLYTVSA